MYKKRKNIDKIKAVIAKEPAVIFIGTRQVGKTTLMKKIEEDFKQEGKNTLYFNLEMPSSLDLFSGVENFISFLRLKGFVDVKENRQQYLYVFIDEFQYIAGAGKFIKALVDNFPWIKIIASGSSSVEIQKTLDESLVGRKRIIKIFPLDFLEFLYFTDMKQARFFEKANANNSFGESVNRIFYQEFESFVIWGGMPKVVLESDFDEKRLLLEEICSSYLQKDIKGLVGSENISRFNTFLMLIAQESSTIMSLNSVANTLNMPRKHLEEYLFILEHTFVNFQVNPFFTNKRKELSKSKKSIFYDTGMRNSLLKNTTLIDKRQDKGMLIESAVYNEIEKNLSPGMEIYYWRTQHQTEVDFVIRYEDAVIPVEVKAGTAKTIPLAAISFAEQYKSPFIIVLNRDYWECIKKDHQTIYFLPFFMARFIPSLIINF